MSSSTLSFLMSTTEETKRVYTTELLEKALSRNVIPRTFAGMTGDQLQPFLDHVLGGRWLGDILVEMDRKNISCLTVSAGSDIKLLGTAIDGSYWIDSTGQLRCSGDVAAGKDLEASTSNDVASMKRELSYVSKSDNVVTAMAPNGQIRNYRADNLLATVSDYALEARIDKKNGYKGLRMASLADKPEYEWLSNEIVDRRLPSDRVRDVEGGLAVAEPNFRMNSPTVSWISGSRDEVVRLYKQCHHHIMEFFDGRDPAWENTYWENEQLYINMMRKILDSKMLVVIDFKTLKAKVRSAMYATTFKKMVFDCSTDNIKKTIDNYYNATGLVPLAQFMPYLLMVNATFGGRYVFKLIAHAILTDGISYTFLPALQRIESGIRKGTTVWDDVCLLAFLDAEVHELAKVQSDDFFVRAVDAITKILSSTNFDKYDPREGSGVVITLTKELKSEGATNVVVPTLQKPGSITLGDKISSEIRSKAAEPIVTQTRQNSVAAKLVSDAPVTVYKDMCPELANFKYDTPNKQDLEIKAENEKRLNIANSTIESIRKQVAENKKYASVVNTPTYASVGTQCDIDKVQFADMKKHIQMLETKLHDAKVQLSDKQEKSVVSGSQSSLDSASEHGEKPIVTSQPKTTADNWTVVSKNNKKKAKSNTVERTFASMAKKPEGFKGVYYTRIVYTQQKGVCRMPLYPTYITGMKASKLPSDMYTNTLMVKKLLEEKLVRRYSDRETYSVFSNAGNTLRVLLLARGDWIARDGDEVFTPWGSVDLTSEGEMYTLPGLLDVKTTDGKSVLSELAITTDKDVFEQYNEKLADMKRSWAEKQLAKREQKKQQEQRAAAIKAEKEDKLRQKEREVAEQIEIAKAISTPDKQLQKLCGNMVSTKANIKSDYISNLNMLSSFYKKAVPKYATREIKCDGYVLWDAVCTYDGRRGEAKNQARKTDARQLAAKQVFDEINKIYLKRSNKGILCIEDIKQASVLKEKAEMYAQASVVPGSVARVVPTQKLFGNMLTLCESAAHEANKPTDKKLYLRMVENFLSSFTTQNVDIPEHLIAANPALLSFPLEQQFNGTELSDVPSMEEIAAWRSECKNSDIDGVLKAYPKVYGIAKSLGQSDRDALKLLVLATFLPQKW